jgi:hypothetical protein
MLISYTMQMGIYKRKWRVAATVVASLFLLAAMAYILIAFIFLEAIYNYQNTVI